MKFNLIDDPWVRCVDHDGKCVEKGIMAVLKEADSLFDIVDASPLVCVAINRLLIAILRRSLGEPADSAEWGMLWKKGWTTSKVQMTKISQYLREWHDRFDLFDKKRPFYQVAGFSLPKPSPAVRLSVERSSQTKPTLFSQHVNSDPTLMSFPECARQLLAAQTYAVATAGCTKSQMFGTHPKYGTSPLMGAGYSIRLKGASLRESLMLNLLPDDKLGMRADDLPIWERASRPALGQRRVSGYMDLLTFQSRVICLVPDENGCRLVYYAGGWEVDPEHRVEEPSCAHFHIERKTKNKTELEEFSVVPRDDAPWQSLDKIFALRDPDLRAAPFRLAAEMLAKGVLEAKQMRFAMTGVAHDKADISAWHEFETCFPSEILTDKQKSDEFCRAVRICEGASAAIRMGVGNALGEGNHADSGLVSFWTAVERPLLRQLQDGLNIDSWKMDVKQAAMEALRENIEKKLGVGAKAFHQIAANEGLIDALIERRMA